MASFCSRITLPQFCVSARRYCSELLRRRVHRFGKLPLDEPLLERRLRHHRSHVGIDLVDDRARRAAGDRDPEPGAGDVARQVAGFRGRRDVGELRQALAAADADHLDLALAVDRQRQADAHHHHVGVAADHVVDRRIGAAIMDRVELDVGGVLEPDDVDVRPGGDARGAVADLAGLCPRALDQRGDVVHAELLRHHRRVVDADQAGDRDEILLDVERQLVLRIEDGIDDVGPGFREHHGVAVGRGVGHLLRADDVRAAALVLDNDLLPPFLGQPGAHRARQDVGDAAGRGGNHEGDVARGVGLGLRGGRKPDASQRRKNSKPLGHVRLPNRS